jgi:hypothetical protein
VDSKERSTQGEDSKEQIHGASAPTSTDLSRRWATKIRGRLEYSRYKEIPVLEAGPSGGAARCESKFKEAYFAGIPKARDMKVLKQWVEGIYRLRFNPMVISIEEDQIDEVTRIKFGVLK